MPPVKGEKLPSSTQNTSAQIQQIFAEVQSQLPSVNFDTDDPNDEGENNELLESPMVDNTDALLDSLSNRNTYSFLTIHPRIDAPQQPPSVELQMRLSPNPFEASTSNQNSPPKSSILSMDLFNSIDFDKLPANVAAPPPSASTYASLSRTFHRPRPIPTPHQQLSSQAATNVKNRDDRQILERLAQQANQFSSNERSPPSAMQGHPLRNLESALYGAVNEQYNRHGKRVGVLESERKTIFIDLRHSQAPKQDEQPSMPRIAPLIEQKATSESESDDDDDEDNGNDGMLWFEKRRLAKQQHLNSDKQ